MFIIKAKLWDRHNERYGNDETLDVTFRTLERAKSYKENSVKREGTWWCAAFDRPPKNVRIYEVRRVQ